MKWAGQADAGRSLHLTEPLQARARATPGREYYERKKASGKAAMEAIRCVKRRLSDIVYQTMLNDVVRAVQTGPGGQRGQGSDSIATGSHPHSAGSSDKSLPGPAEQQPTTPLPAVS